ncbi:MAG TPA: hydrolase [Vitreimonas sp.]|uniref:hydrolase n=1 Tax=Vitreimonas sp. TaxID=3069702 RepID=UPI002D22C985|nr:hydrolase [Vitreimonas sp.]HYD89242.1 hydrolase [Vitreimonas sp.]
MSADVTTPPARSLGAGLEPFLERLDAQGEALAARTEAWSAINSGSYELAGLTRMRAPLLDAVAALPGEVAEVELQPSQRVRPDGEVIDIEHGASIRVRVRPHAPVQVALTGHYDTVFPAAHPFQKPWRDGAMLRGPGTADMKGGIAVMLAALEAFEAAPGDKLVGYEVLLSPDEEVGSMASAPLLAELGARAQVGMTYEPALADGALVDARKGSGNFSLIVKGRAAHVGRAFSDGRSAVIAAAEAALALNALNAQREGVTFNVGAIDGGSAVNVVPDRAVLRFNIRSPDAEGAAWGEAQARRIAEAAHARDGISAHLHGGITRPPKPLNVQQRTIVSWTRAAGEALGLDLKFQSSGGVCEGNNLAAAGCPNIDTLGPCGGGLHSDQEFALLSSFSERAKLSFLMLAGLNSGAFDVRSLGK